MEIEELTIKQVLELAVKKHNEGDLSGAEFLYRKILKENPNNADAWHLLGLTAYQVGKYDEAIGHINKAISINPNQALFYSNLGMVYDASGEEDEAAENFLKALNIDPNYTKANVAHYNLGVFCMEKGKIMEALEHYNRAIELDKDFYEARWNRSLVLLLLGKFEEGWKDYEYRFKKEKPTDSRVFDKPKWDGSSLEGKRILILSEQGFGDNINFIRYIPLIKEKKGYIILECKRELRRLFEDFPGIDEFVEMRSGIVPSVKFDFYIHLMSLPGVFGTNLSNIPNKVPYIFADAELSEKFKLYFNEDCFNIGIVWAGNPEQANDKNRSAEFGKFKVLKNIPKVKLYSLQKGGVAQQLDDSHVINMADKINDFSDTAAIIENLDLVISVDTSVAHLAGAMGKPVWTILTFMPDWRYMLGRNDSLWYPSMRLFRQQKLGDWDFVFNEVSKELGKIIRDKQELGNP